MALAPTEPFDLIIIGAGAAGLSVASGGAQLGLKVALVEAGEMGGDCLNAGCVPSKALLAAAKAAHQLGKGAPQLGVTIKGGVDVDYAAVMAHVRGAIDHIAPHDSQERFEGLGVDVIRAKGQLVDKNVVKADGRLLKGKIIVLATGASPVVPPIPGLEDVHYDTNETLFQRTQRPDHLVVVGGGPIGCEMAQAHARLGCQVTLIEMASLLPNDDPEAAALVRQSLADDGVRVLEHHRLVQLIKTADGFDAHCDQPEGQLLTIPATDLLMAVGRRPNVNGLGLDHAGVAHSVKGIQVDGRLQTNVKNIYALGDVTGQAQFTHMAGAHASAFVRGVLFRMRVDMERVQIPWVTYCDPELAQFGMTEDQARQSGQLASVHRVDLKDLDRQVTEADAVGFGKIMLDRKNHLLGVTMVGKGAGELLTPWLVMNSGKVKLHAAAAMIVPYPTRGEVTKRLASMAFVDRLFSDKTKRIVRFLFGLPRF